MARTAHPSWLPLHPPTQERPNGTEFPLHCDLWQPETLMNVYDAVASDQSGESLFLHIDKLIAILETIHGVPPTHAHKVRSALRNPLSHNAYDKFYDLLHHRRHPFRGELQKQMHHAALSVFLDRGQGYVVHDRTWLHGHATCNQRITGQRLYRLVFATRSQQRITSLHPDH